MLKKLISWFEEEQEKGSRVKASKIYRVFCKYAKEVYPGVTSKQLEEYKDIRW